MLRFCVAGCVSADVLCLAEGLAAVEHGVGVVCVLEFCAALSCVGSSLCVVRCVLSLMLGVCCARVVFISCG